VSAISRRARTDAGIPAEISVRPPRPGRFADPQSRMFPVAVTFLVPEKLARDDTHTGTLPSTTICTEEKRRYMSAKRHHAEWLSLVDVSGPFVTLPVLERVSTGIGWHDPNIPHIPLGL